MTHDRISRRQAVAGIGSVLGALAVARTSTEAEEATPEASTVAGKWTYTDGPSTTVTLPQRPVRIAANLVTAAALWDLGAKAIAVFDWTTSAHPDGDRIAWVT